MGDKTKKFFSYTFFGPLSKHSRFGQALDSVKYGTAFRRYLIVGAYLQTVGELARQYATMREEQAKLDEELERLESLLDAQRVMEQDWVHGTAIPTPESYREWLAEDPLVPSGPPDEDRDYTNPDDIHF